MRRVAPGRQPDTDPTEAVRLRGLRRVAPGLALGIVCIVAGGLVAAVTSTAPSEHGAWAAAYLVLVAGVAQVALAAGQALLAARQPSSRVLLAEMLAWNAGNAAVLAGTLVGVAVVVDVGGALLVVALALTAAVLRGARRGLLLLAFRLLLVLLLVSIPIGLWLAHLRA